MISQSSLNTGIGTYFLMPGILFKIFNRSEFTQILIEIRITKCVTSREVGGGGRGGAFIQSSSLLLESNLKPLPTM